MPTYEYKCEKCEHSFDELQSIKADPLTTCPECKGAIHRVINGGAGLIFKGTGFYITDYKNKNTGAGNGKDKSSKTETEQSESSDKKTESTKTEKKTSDNKK